MREKVDFKKMTGKQKAGYIWEYYKVHILVVIAVVAFLITIIHHYATAKEAVVTILPINAENAGTGIEPDFSDFMEEYHYDSKKQEIVVSSGYTFDSNDPTRSSYSYQALITVLSAGGADVVSADEQMYAYLAQAGICADLSEFYSKEELEQMGESVYYVTDPDTNEEYAVGIRMGSDSWMVKEGFYKEDYVIGIAGGSKYRDGAKQMLSYIVER